MLNYLAFVGDLGTIMTAKTLNAKTEARSARGWVVEHELLTREISS